MTIRTLGQERAEFALGSVLAINEDKKKDFKSFSAGAPSMILQNGFGQTLAFWMAKTKKDQDGKKVKTDKHYTVFKIIMDWLVDRKFVNSEKIDKEFIQAICELNQLQYLTAQKETLALLEWVKRYANSGF